MVHLTWPIVIMFIIWVEIRDTIRDAREQELRRQLEEKEDR